MAYYLLQIAFAPAVAADLLRNPESRLESLRPAAERLGGSVEDGWLAFGEYDLVLLLGMPDNIRAAAFSTAVSTGGTVKAARITPLMTIREAVEAAQQAAGGAIEGLPPLPEDGDGLDRTPEMIQDLITPNLEYAAACVESAYQVITELGLQETLPTMNTAVAHGLHFLQLAQSYLHELQQQVRPTDRRKDAPEE